MKPAKKCPLVGYSGDESKVSIRTWRLGRSAPIEIKLSNRYGKIEHQHFENGELKYGQMSTLIRSGHYACTTVGKNR